MAKKKVEKISRTPLLTLGIAGVIAVYLDENLACLIVPAVLSIAAWCLCYAIDKGWIDEEYDGGF